MRRLPRPLVAAAAAVVFLVACALIRGGLLRGEQLGDVRLYAQYARRMVDGRVPYRDFFFEYPPGSLPAILLPGLVSTAHYTVLFKWLMALCGVATILLADRIASAAGMAAGRAALILGALALAPLALGPIVLDEYDLWPALVTVGALLALVAGRDRLGCGLLGFGAAAKVFPAAILPVALVVIYRRTGSAAAKRALLSFAVAAVATYVAFVALAPGGVWYSTHVQLRRGLQKESLGSAILLVLDQLGLYKARIVEGNPHWTELTGPAGDALAAAGTVCQVAAALAVAAIAARRRPEPRMLLCAAAAAVAGFVAFGKVFSPQYLIWLVPLVPLGAGVLETVLLAAALVLTQLWFLDYVTPFDLDSGVWLVVARDALMLALFVVLVLRLRRFAPAAAPRTARTATPGPGRARAGST